MATEAELVRPPKLDVLETCRLWAHMMSSSARLVRLLIKRAQEIEWALLGSASGLNATRVRKRQTGTKAYVR